MIGNLDEAIRALLLEELPDLFVGTPSPPVGLSVVNEAFVLDPRSADTVAGEPRVDDQTDDFAFDAAAPDGPYTLTKPPLPGPRRIYLTSALGDRVALGDAEVAFEPDDAGVFRLSPRADRVLDSFDGVRALYGVTSVFVEVRAQHDFVVHLDSGNATTLERAEALALAVIELNRKRVLDQALATFSSGDYSARVRVESLKLVQGTAPSTSVRELHFSAAIVTKAMRALGADEGRPIVRISTPGQNPDPARPVDIRIEVEA